MNFEKSPMLFKPKLELHNSALQNTDNNMAYDLEVKDDSKAFNEAWNGNVCKEVIPNNGTYIIDEA